MKFASLLAVLVLSLLAAPSQAPKRLTGDPRIDGGMWVRQCSNGRCTSRWVPLADLPEFARRPVMQVPEKSRPVYVPQSERRGFLKGMFGR